MKIVLLGSPGVGKGTYSAELIKKYEILHISTGDIFRENIKGATELGKKAKEFIDTGNLVPDELTIEMIKERLGREDCETGFLLDGFPRTIPQAEALSQFCELDMVINVKADDEVIIERLSGRRICRQCGKIFHLKNIPSKVEGVCDACEGDLYQRDDDRPQAIQERLKVYQKQTAPLVDYYRAKGLLREITVNEDFGTNRELILNRFYEVIGKN